ncbi:class I adenylate-forming enzyme family protein [Thermodesulfobacteriota bacterium]
MDKLSMNEVFTDSFLKRGDKKAITFLRNGEIETEISYLELDRDSSQMANTLIDLGVGKGDRVILFLPKSLVFLVAHIALQKIGAVSVPLNPGFKKSEMSYFIEDADTGLVISGEGQEAMINEIAPELANLVIDTRKRYQDLDFFRSASDVVPGVEILPDDSALIIYTSGTTGLPKGAVLTQRNLIHDAENIIKIWEITESDTLCHALPLFHVHGLCFALHTSLLAGAHVLLLDQFFPKTVIETLMRKDGEEACTLFMAVPAMYSILMDYAWERNPDFSNMRLWTSGSAPLLPKDFHRIKDIFGKGPVEREGMSETGMNFSNPIKGERKPGSIGLPLPDLKVRIVNPETFQDVETGRRGEIWLKGPSVSPGYWKKPDETAKAFENGWFRTGDLGRVDEDGYYYLTDRIKHIIISGGENISPKEIEGVINQLGDVVESCVIGIPDEKWGEKVIAAVVTKAGSVLKTDDVRSYCKEYLHDWKCPKEVVFLKELPKNRMGKVLKEKLKESLDRGSSL